jgi:ABC-type protease/lipase transport system fused ATPase/permease subunit
MMECNVVGSFSKRIDLPPYRRDLLLEKVLAHFGHHLRAAARIAELHDYLSGKEEEDDDDEVVNASCGWMMKINVSLWKYPEFVVLDIGTVESDDAGVVAVAQHLDLLRHRTKRIVIRRFVWRGG